MGWQERDYDQQTWRESSARGWRFRAPPRGTAILLGLHVTAFALLWILAAQSQDRVAARLMLSASSAQPVGVVVHPLSTRDPLTLIITLLVLWMLAGRLEQQYGFRRTLGHYLLGNLLAGLAFFLLARSWPALAGVELDYPAGAFAAWCVAAYRGMSDEMVVVLGRLRRVSRLVGIGLVVVVGLMLGLRGLGAVGWLAALAAGALAEPTWSRLTAVGAVATRPRRKLVRPSAAERPAPSKAAELEPEIDDILAKISRAGLGSLTDDERKRLEAARRAKLHGSKDLNASR